jgi:hypothetical protein
MFVTAHLHLVLRLSAWSYTSTPPYIFMALRPPLNTILSQLHPLPSQLNVVDFGLLGCDAILPEDGCEMFPRNVGNHL